MNHVMPADGNCTPVMHVAGWAWTLGGLQSVLRHHVDRDTALGCAPRVIALFDRVAPSSQPARLGARAWTWVGVARRRFARLAAPMPGAVVLHHDGWGLRWWADRDGASRRVLYLHTEVPHLESLLRSHAPRLDAVFSISQSMIDRLRGAVPEFPAERCFRLPYFVEAPPFPDVTERPLGQPWMVGYAGRLERSHKRVERLPALIAALDATGIDYRFEIMGSGREEASLRRTLAGRSRVVFRGRLSGVDYWRALAGWDCLVLPSDYEGFSRVAMEGMMVGVLPVIPAYSAAAAEMVGPLGEAGLYPTGDMQAAARRIVALAALAPDRVAAKRRELKTHLAGHTVAAYNAAYDAALERVRHLPPRAEVRGPAWWEPLLPLGLHTRLFPVRF